MIVPVRTLKRLRQPPHLKSSSRIRDRPCRGHIADTKTMLTFEGKSGLETPLVRPVREAALMFDDQDGTLDIVASGGGKARRHAIAGAFIETMLASGAVLAGRARRTLALDVLKKRRDFPIHPEDHVRGVEVAKLVLGAPDFGSIVTFEVRSRDVNPHNIYERTKREFGPSGIPGRQDTHVISAKRRIMFE